MVLNRQTKLVPIHGKRTSHERIGTEVEEELQEREADDERRRAEGVKFSRKDGHCIALQHEKLRKRCCESGI